MSGDDNLDEEIERIKQRILQVCWSMDGEVIYNAIGILEASLVVMEEQYDKEDHGKHLDGAKINLDGIDFYFDGELHDEDDNALEDD